PLILLSLLIFVIIFTGCGGVEISINFVVDGEVYKTVTTTGEETIKMPENPVKDGYVFDGWYWDNDTFQKPFTANSLLEQELMEDMTVYAKWVSEELAKSNHTVTFNSVGGSEVPSQTVKHSNLLTEPQAPTKGGYIFVGWYKLADYSEKWNFETDKVVKDITLYAKWSGTALEHTHTYTAVITEPTCLTAGYTTHTCICGESYVDTYTDPTGHKYTPMVTEPTCLLKGYTTYTCVCGDSYIDDYTDPAGHNAENGICKYCGLKTESIGLIYTLNSDKNSYTLTDVGNCTDIDLVIPSAYEGLPVTAIGEGAFLYCDLITSVVIQDSVISIGNGAFDDCINIEQATIPAVAISAIPKNSLEKVVITSGESIAANAFSGCASLKSVVIPDSVTSIGNSAFDGCVNVREITAPSIAISYIPKNSLEKVVITSGASISENAFKDCTILTSVVMANSIKGIEASAFYGCTSLESIVLSNAIRSIGERAFYGCTALTSVNIPASVRSLGDNVFCNCTSLTSINVDGENISYVSIDDVLYTKDVTTLIQSSVSKATVDIPNSVTSIESYAFSGCTALTSIVISNGVTSIGEKAFYNCTSLTIYAQATSKPSGWNSDWTYSSCPVEWGYEYAMVDGIMYGIKNGVATVLRQPKSIKEKEANIPKSITHNGVNYLVTSIGWYAFYNCASLTSVTIGDSVTSIGNYAFDGCTSLTSITIPNSVTSIGSYAFYD
ncbi:MAG: leucine-rich repeat protein, partial [Clostridia bacterium]|nr:leucine-rich repeat protein [Clostridia bacterium]